MSPLLKKSFDPAKCKTLLQITAQKLKVLRNKHALAVKSSRADVARLLEKSHDKNAEMEVDRVYREEKMVALYNVLEQFCQLVSSHLESMKSQRECPLDLKEAVASLIYAASSCDEVEELKKVSGYLTKKYGSEFSLAAKELRAGCYVNTKVIENLSSIPLSFNARMTLLKDIALEKKINWDYDASKQSADSLDGLAQSTNGVHTTNLSGFERQAPLSTSVRVDEVSEQASGALKNMVSSQIVSPKASFDSHPQSIYERASSGKDIPPLISDPYASAKSRGRLDYKFVSDYMVSDHVIKGRLNSTTSLQSDHQSQSLGSYQRKPKNAAATQELQRQLKELETVTKVAFESATEAAKAAMVAVSIVQKQSSEMIRDFQFIQKPEGRYSESTFSPLLSDSSFGQIRDKPTFSPSKDDSRLGTGLNTTVPEDFGEVQSKYVISEQKSGSQHKTSRVELTKVHIMMAEGEESSHIEKPSGSSFDSIINTGDEQLEVDWKSSYGQKQRGFFAEMSLHQNKSVQSLPQSDDSRSNKQETPYFLPENSNSGEQYENLSSTAEIQQEKDVLKLLVKPQFDDYSSENSSSDEEEMPLYSPENSSSGQHKHTNLSSIAEIRQDQDGWEKYEEHQFENNTEQEIPFYLKGRVAKMKVEFDDELAGAPSCKLTSIGPHAVTGESSESSRVIQGSLSPRETLKASSLETCSLDSASPSEGFSDHEGPNPLIQVRRDLNYRSASSDHLALKAQSFIESCKPSWREGSSLHPSAAPSVEACKPDSGLGSSDTPRSSRAKYTAMLKKSLRSSWH